MRCDQCKYWGELAWNDNHPRHEFQRICEKPDAKMEPLGDYVATEPDFGCVHFETK